MKRTLLFVSLCFMLIAAWAQPAQPGQPRFDPQKFQVMMEAELTKAANLTEDEAKVIFPLHKEMRQKQMEIGKQIRQLKANSGNDAKASANAINKILDLKVKMAEVEGSYYKRMIKMVGAEKVMNIIKAEDDFYRRMVQRQRDGRWNKGPRQHKNHNRPENKQ